MRTAPRRRMDTRRRAALTRVRLRQGTAQLRALPDFLVLGGQRCGTSSLYRYLGAHPDVVASVRKETEYFSREYQRGPEWYRAHFPLALRRGIHHRIAGLPLSTFEATPDYLFDPRAPLRVRTTLPDARFIVLLREPVERAFSHYRHMRRLGFEGLSFAASVACEDERISPDLDRAARDPDHRLGDALRFSYAARGEYAVQLERWFEHFPRSSFLVLDSQDLFDDTRRAMHQVCSFLGLRPWAPTDPVNHSRPQHTDPTLEESLPDAVRARLEERFAAPNAALEQLLAQQPLRFTTRSEA